MERIISEIKDAFDGISPYIQRHTAEVCPSCPSVCCIDRHGRYEENDIVFINAIGMDTCNRTPDRPDTEPCRFLEKNGCFLPRYRRPFRCTWYFCDRLLESMQKDKAREYRAFVSAFQRLQDIRLRLLEMNESEK